MFVLALDGLRLESTIDALRVFEAAVRESRVDEEANGKATMRNFIAMRMTRERRDINGDEQSRVSAARTKSHASHQRCSGPVKCKTSASNQRYIDTCIPHQASNQSLLPRPLPPRELLLRQTQTQTRKHSYSLSPTTTSTSSTPLQLHPQQPLRARER